jgi:hypothetical protein
MNYLNLVSDLREVTATVIAAQGKSKSPPPRLWLLMASAWVKLTMPWRIVYWLSGAYLLADRRHEVFELIRQAAQLPRARKKQGAEAWTLRLLGEMHFHQDPPSASLPHWGCVRSRPSVIMNLACCIAGLTKWSGHVPPCLP